jgi:hypothetical protein
MNGFIGRLRFLNITLWGIDSVPELPKDPFDLASETSKASVPLWINFQRGRLIKQRWMRERVGAICPSWVTLRFSFPGVYLIGVILQHQNNYRFTLCPLIILHTDEISDALVYYEDHESILCVF